MNYCVVEKDNVRYIEVLAAESPIGTEEDALNIIALCGETEASRLILHRAALSEDFFKLRTGVAGAVMQKLVNYGLRTALLLQDPANYGARFQEWVVEANKRSEYRFFKNIAEAEDWLLQ